MLGSTVSIFSTFVLQRIRVQYINSEVESKGGGKDTCKHTRTQTLPRPYPQASKPLLGGRFSFLGSILPLQRHFPAGNPGKILAPFIHLFSHSLARGGDGGESFASCALGTCVHLVGCRRKEAGATCLQGEGVLPYSGTHRCEQTSPWVHLEVLAPAAIYLYPP